MESRIPVPTDNIFKFYALFGLLLLLFSMGTAVYLNTSSNAELFAAIPELEGLKQNSQRSAAESAKMAVLQRRIDITISDKKSLSRILGAIGGVALLIMAVGFWKWHTEVQPVLDRTAKVQLEIAELQLAKLQREVGIPSASPGTVETKDPAPKRAAAEIVVDP